MRGPSRGASRRGGRSGDFTGFSRTSTIRQNVGRRGRGAMSHVASTVMTLASTPTCRATTRRWRQGLIRSTAPHRGDTTGALPAMSAIPRSRRITPGSRPIAGARFISRAGPRTWGNRLIRRWLRSLICLRRHLPRQCQHNPRHRPVIHAALPHRYQAHLPRRARAATKVRGHHECLLEA